MDRELIPAITTPFTPSLDVDHEFLARHVGWLVESGCNGVVADERLARAEVESARLQHELEQQEAVLRELDRDTHALTLELVAVEKDLERLEGERPRWTDRLDVARFEAGNAATEHEQSAIEVATLTHALAGLGDERIWLESELREQQQRAASVSLRVEQLGEALTAVKVRVAAERQRHEAATAGIAGLERERGELDARLPTSVTDLEQAEAERGELAAAVELAIATRTARQAIFQWKCKMQNYRPVILLGNGIRNHRGMLDWATSLNIPVLLTWMAADLLPEDSPVFCGRPGIFGQRAANIIQQKATHLFCFGARLDGEQVAYDYDRFAPNAEIYVYDIDPKESKFPERYHFASELWQFPRPAPANPEWLVWCKALYCEFRGELEPAGDSSKYVDPFELMWFLHGDLFFSWERPPPPFLHGSPSLCNTQNPNSPHPLRGGSSRRLGRV